MDSVKVLQPEQNLIKVNFKHDGSDSGIEEANSLMNRLPNELTPLYCKLFEEQGYIVFLADSTSVLEEIRESYNVDITIL